jgi:hypothetical protein
MRRVRNKQINIIVRDPSQIIKELGRNYETLTFSPEEDKQDYFENLVYKEIGDVTKTELYINGSRYYYPDFYELSENNVLQWKGNWDLSTDDILVFVWR